VQINKNNETGERGAWLGLAAYLSLSAFKLAAGWATGSAALIADGLNNASDIGVTVAILIGLRLSRKPPDHNHPYGHRRAETVASLVASFLMAAVGFQVLIEAGRRMFGQEDIAPPDPMAAAVAAVSAAIMFGVSFYNSRLAARAESEALAAAAADNRSDALVSTGALIGIGGAQFGLPWLDPLTAAAVGLVILYTAWNIFYSSTLSLTDGYDEKKLSAYRATAANTKGVLGVKEMRARAHGSHVCLDLTIFVDPELNVVESHRIAETVENRLKRKYRVLETHVHIEPLERA
jgi:cation diffusion facilitator family transporter